jgi:hypothetical protein
MSPKLLSPFLVAVVGLGVYGCAADDGIDDESSLEQDVTAAPTNLTATVLSPQKIRLNWNPIAGAGVNYVVLKGTAPGNERTLSSTSPAGSTTLTDDNNTPNTQLCYTVKAVANNSASPASNEVCVFTAAGPTPPTNVVATTTGTTSINITWSPVTGVARYYVFESVGGGAFNQIGSVAPPTTSFLAEGLNPGTNYAFAVKTFIPANLFSPLSDPSAATTFSGGLEGYYRFDERVGSTAIDRSLFQRNGTLVAGAVLTTADSAPLKDSTDHNPSSLSLPTPTAFMSATGTLTFSSNSESSVSMWVKLLAAPTGPLTIIGRRAAGCGAIQWQLGQDATNGLNFAGSTVRSFGRSLTVGAWTQIGVAQRGATVDLSINGVQVATGAFTVGPLGTTTLQIGDVGGCGNGGAFLVDEVKLFSHHLSAIEMLALGQAPPAPTGLRVTEFHSDRLQLSWNPVPNAEEYHVFKGSAPGNEVFATSNPNTTFRADHLTPNETTTWRIVAVRGGLLSLPSAELIATTNPPPPAPTGLTATLNTCCSPQRVDLTWNAVTGTIRYYLFQSENGGPFTQIGSTDPTIRTFTAAGLNGGSTYLFQVESQDDGFTFSAPSASASATIPVPTP